MGRQCSVSRATERCKQPPAAAAAGAAHRLLAHICIASARAALQTLQALVLLVLLVAQQAAARMFDHTKPVKREVARRRNQQGRWVRTATC